MVIVNLYRRAGKWRAGLRQVVCFQAFVNVNLNMCILGVVCNFRPDKYHLKAYQTNKARA